MPLDRIIAPISATEQRIEVKTCPTCAKSFETNVAARVYCSARCARRAKSQRYRSRGVIAAGNATLFELDRRSDCDYVKNPTVAMIMAVAQNREGLKKRPTIFYGTVPEVTEPMPQGIAFTQQEDRTWLMLA